MGINSDNYQGKNYNVGIYCRLSNDDGENVVSNSIENQKVMLTKYAIENGWKIVDIYIDDGYTGTNFERPGFKRLLRDIEKGHVSIVVTKDMSRLGRDYIQVGYYIERYFPEHAIRYIALNDNIDTGKDMGNNDITPFKAIMNDMYSKDISKKIRSVFDLKRHQGKFIGSFAPYGYEKDPEDKSRLIIDRETAWVVRRIFNMYLMGNGLKSIAHKLNEERISSPSVYKSKKIKTYNPGRMKVQKWSHSGIKHVLTNVTYTGDLAQGKTEKINYKSKKIKRFNMNDWFVVEGTHDPIISKEEFRMVQDLMNQKNKNFGGAKKSVRLFSGLVFCGDCGHHMTYHKMPKGYYFLICSTYKKYGKKECSRHSLLEEKLEEMILDDFNRLAHKFSDKEKLKKKAEKILNDKNEKKKEYKEELLLLDKRLEDLQFILKKLYEDKVKGLLDENQLIGLFYEFNNEKKYISQRKDELLEKQREQVPDEKDNGVKKIVEAVLNFQKLNRVILNELIHKVEIFEDGHMIIHYKIKKPY